jgi:hypothetical protein
MRGGDSRPRESREEAGLYRNPSIGQLHVEMPEHSTHARAEIAGREIRATGRQMLT